MYSKINDTEIEDLIALLSTSESKIKNGFLIAIRTLKNQISIEEVEQLLNQGNIEAAVALVTSIPAAVSTLINRQFVAAGDNAASAIADKTEVIIDFDTTNTRAVNVMSENRLRLIREFTEGQREAVRAALVQGINEGLNPRDVARTFRDSIGLTQRQVQAVNNYGDLLRANSSEALNRQLRDRRFDNTIRRAIINNEPLTTIQVDRMVSRYRERFIIHRSEVIARTEALRSVNQGTEEMYQQAFNTGALDPGTITKEWITASDSRVRDSHNGMDGQKVFEGEVFISDFGNTLRFPGDPNAPGSETIHCRCVVSRRIN